MDTHKLAIQLTKETYNDILCLKGLEYEINNEKDLSLWVKINKNQKTLLAKGDYIVKYHTGKYYDVIRGELK